MLERKKLKGRTQVTFSGSHSPASAASSKNADLAGDRISHTAGRRGFLCGTLGHFVCARIRHWGHHD